MYVNEIKESSDKIKIQGWVHDLRDLANIKFILLRDSTGVIQCAIKEDSKAFHNFGQVSFESVIEIEGEVTEAKVKSPEVSVKSCEIQVSNLRILNKAEPLPIPVLDKRINTGLSKRLDNRSLDIRKEKVKAIFQIQNVLMHAFREYFYKKEFIEIQPPGIIGTSTEGGTELFEAKYFEKNAYLAQSPQLYKQLCAISWERVVSTSPVWRAEKHNTTRHLNEARQMDIEVAFVDQFKVMKYLEDVMKYMIKQVMKDCKKQIDLLNLKLKIPKAKYLSYKETVQLLKSKGVPIEYGDDLEPEVEKKLCELYKDSLVFVHSWPNSLKPFYIWPLDKDTSAGFDMLYGGLELSSGGQRVHVPTVLIENLRSKGLDPENFSWYIDGFRYGAPVHAGWSIGLERLTMVVCELENIREACIFPRDRDRLTP
ncbi:aspartate--tRNA(Asn) ligase [archaeon]|nr:aspartate--tRNA(Asn) ligase [archaeon]